jgi:7-cyano-7-deazaguanine tRNA-ribosyltransferase
MPGLKRDGLEGFCNRATHNLWILLEEEKWVQEHLSAGTYFANFQERLNNSTYVPLIRQVAKMLPVGKPQVNGQI